MLEISPTSSQTHEVYGSTVYGCEEKNKCSELKRPDLKGSFRCNICSKIFCHSSSLSRHRMQAHFKTYKCTVCSKDLANSDSVRNHMFKNHHISRMFMCRCCNWAFPDKSLLHIHLQSTNLDAQSSIHSQIANTIPFETLLPIVMMGSAAAPSPPPNWLAQLPKPIPLIRSLIVEKKEEEMEFSRNSSQSPSSSCGSFKSDSHLSAFHQLNSDRTLLISPVDSSSSPSSSRVSPRGDCFDCQISKSKLLVAENKCKYLESRANTLQNEAVDAHSEIANLENTIHRMKVEAKMIREHNEIFQKKLLDCQSLAVRFLQSDKMSCPREVHEFLNHLLNSTILLKQ